MTDSPGYGQQQPSDSNSHFNAVAFLVRQMTARMMTMKLVQIVDVHSNGAVAAAGTVDVLPLVSQIDGNGNVSQQGTVFGIPWYRLQGGKNAVICDPQKGDIGYVDVSDRDISAVKTNRKASAPGSFRRFDIADGVYVGGLLNDAPDQYLVFTDTGIKLADKNGNVIEMKSGSIAFTTALLTVNGRVVAGFGTVDQVELQTHKHPTAATGAPSPPTPGT